MAIDYKNDVSPGKVGTEYFMAPEVMNDEPYGKPADIWSCGVLLYILVNGSYPFKGTRDRLRDNIINGKYNVSSMAIQR